MNQNIKMTLKAVALCLFVAISGFIGVFNSSSESTVYKGGILTIGAALFFTFVALMMCLVNKISSSKFSLSDSIRSLFSEKDGNQKNGDDKVKKPSYNLSGAKTKISNTEIVNKTGALD